MIITEKDLSPDQKIVYDAVLKWYNDKNNKLFIVSGFAGTGKTSILSCLAHKFENAAYCCFTGKAALVLRNKLDKSGAKYASCGTIHSLQYIPIVDQKTLRVRGWMKRPTIDEDIIILDEGSMVGGKLFRDLQLYGKKILIFGDGAQLYPIDSDIYLMSDPNCTLTQIHRQALDNPIIKLSMMIRNDQDISNFSCSDNRIKIMSQNSDELDSIILNMFKDEEKRLDSAILCYFNKSRTRINSIIRRELGFDEDPQSGDVAICLKNTSLNDKIIFNGMRGLIKSCYLSDNHKYNADIDFPYDDIKINEYLCRYQFGFEKTFESPIDLESFGYKVKSWEKMGMLFDYGYAITVHKSQGSEFNDVVVFVERSKYQSDDDFRRWMYTAVTRSSNNLVIVY